MRPFSLKFRLKSLEAEYHIAKLSHNTYGFHVIFTFNMVLMLILCFLSLLNHSLWQFMFSMFSLVLVLLTFPLMRVQGLRKRFLDYIIIYLILFPYFVGIYFFMGAITSNFEALAGGFVFNMYLSFPIRVKMSWYLKLCIHLPAYMFIELRYYLKDEIVGFAFIAMITIMILNLLFDFYQDKMERRNFLIEHYFKKNNEVFQHLFTNVIPEEILIWKSNGLSFANKSALELFQVNRKEELEPLLLRSIEIQEIETVDHFLLQSSPNRETNQIPFHVSDENLFLKKIHEILNSESNKEPSFLMFTAKICVPSQKKITSPTKKSNLLGECQLNGNGKRHIEFDIKMRKFFWDEHEAVLIILNAVEERNLKSRLEFVNSYLNYLLANLSHEIYTPLNGLLGMLEVSITNLKNNPIIKENLVVARNSADFLLTITQDLFDFYNIRRGKLVVNVSRISLQIFIKELLLMFSTYFEKENLQVSSTLENHVIHSDPQKLKQILIGIINHIMHSIFNAKISVVLKPSLQTDHILIEINAVGQAINQNRLNEKMASPSSLKVSRRLTYDRKYNYTDGIAPEAFNEIKNAGRGNLELHLIKYLSLSLAPEIDVPFEKKERKYGGSMEVNYQIFLNDIKESKTSVIEDMTEDNISFEVEYRLDYLELFQSNSENNSPQLMNFLKLNNPKNLSPEKPNTINIRQTSNELNGMKESLTSPLYTNIENNTPEAVNSSVFEEHKNEDLSLKQTIERHSTLKNPNFLFSPPTNLKRQFSHEQLFSEVTGESPPMTKKMKKTTLVLNVDDNPINLMVITNYCRMSDFRVVEASNGLDAVEKTKSLYSEELLCFDMVFMDCDMPIMDGFQATENILKFYDDNIEPRPPIVAITANDTYEDRMKAQKCGMMELVKKPLSRNKFEDLISYWTVRRKVSN